MLSSFGFTSDIIPNDILNDLSPLVLNGYTKWWKSWDSICSLFLRMSYRKTSNISGILVGNKIVENSYVVGASPVGAAPTTSSFSI